MLRKAFSEFGGTFFLVFAGTTAIVADKEMNGIVSHLGIAAVFGLVVMAMIYALGNISGAHMNPAVTIALTANGTLPPKEVPVYILSQVAGAFTASLVVKQFFPANLTLGATLPFDGSWATAFSMEFILTFLLVFVIVRVIAAKELNVFAGLIIGGVVFLDALFGGPICGASMNPARSLSPAVVSGQTDHLWVYLASPTLAGLVAVFINKMLFSRKESEE